MTQNPLTIYHREASKVDKGKRELANHGLSIGLPITKVGSMVGLCMADMTAIFHADGHDKTKGKV